MTIQRSPGIAKFPRGVCKEVVSHYEPVAYIKYDQDTQGHSRMKQSWVEAEKTQKATGTRALITVCVSWKLRSVLSAYHWRKLTKCGLLIKPRLQST